MTRFVSPLIVSLLIIVVAGCAGDAGQPVLPQSSTPGAGLRLRATKSPVSVPVHTLWGYWQCALDVESQEISALPARTALLHINAVGPLNSTPGISVSIDKPASDPPNGLFVLTVGLTHPFAGKPKLAGFDVRGILITTAGESADGLPLPGEDDPMLLNADGYTRWWNPTEFTTPGLLGYTPGKLGKEPPPGNPIASAINPYRQFADGLYYTNDIMFLTLLAPTSPNGRGVFRSGAANSRLYSLQFPIGSPDPTGPMLYFNYAVDASWAKPANDPPMIPNDFPLEANSDEAFILKADVTSNSLWAIEGTPLAGGELELEIECWDWQGWMDDYNGEIGPLKLVSPFCDFDEGVIPDVDASPDGKAILTATVPGVPLVEGEIPVWVGVTAPGTSYKQAAQPAPDEPVAAYTLIYIEVAEPECQENNSSDCDSAWSIMPEDSKTGVLCLEVDETDWYAFTVPPAGSAEGTIHLTGYGIGDLNLFLYVDCPASLIDFSSHPGIQDEEIVLEDLGPGEYYIQVLMPSDGDYTPRPYELTTSITGLGAECTTDDDNSWDHAQIVAIDGGKSGSVCLYGDPGDWYTFDITTGSAAYGTIDLDNKDYANNDIALYEDPDEDPLYIGNLPGTSSEHLDVAVLYSGTFYLMIEAKDTAPTGDRAYDLSLNLTETSVECDNQDGNNMPDEALQISLVATEAGTVCFPTDPDWYKFDAGAEGASGTITLSSGDLYDNDLALFDDPAEPPIHVSNQVGNMDEVIPVTDLAEGTYYIRATASEIDPGTNQDYTLSTNLTAQAENPTDFWVHFQIVRTSEGTNPATEPERIESDVAWANEFYGIWIDGTVSIAEISYIDNTAWLSISTFEASQMFEQYNDGCGALHVFYVNDIADVPGAAAYTLMECQFVNNSHLTAYVVVSDVADLPVLAHEMGHAVGVLADTYLLDFFTCAQITYCDTGPTDIYCDEADAAPGNLMYWPVDNDINSYWLSNTDLEMLTMEIDSQAENYMHFNTYYPDAFYKP